MSTEHHNQTVVKLKEAQEKITQLETQLENLRGEDLGRLQREHDETIYALHQAWEILDTIDSDAGHAQKRIQRFREKCYNTEQLFGRKDPKRGGGEGS